MSFRNTGELFLRATLSLDFWMQNIKKWLKTFSQYCKQYIQYVIFVLISMITKHNLQYRTVQPLKSMFIYSMHLVLGWGWFSMNHWIWKGSNLPVALRRHYWWLGCFESSRQIASVVGSGVSQLPLNSTS